MRKNLKLWIAQSESWYTFEELALPSKYRASYSFIKRPEDFYISLVGELFNLLNGETAELIKREVELLSVAKGLAIFSLDKTKINFSGINVNKNILYASSLYFLAGYSASSWILGNLYQIKDNSSFINIFLASFLSRKFHDNNYYSALLKTFIKTGNNESFEELKYRLHQGLDNAFINNFSEYTSYKVALKIIEKFERDNVWFTLSNELRRDREIWTDYIVENLIERHPPIWDFFPSQKLALEKGLLINKTSSLQMPTSAGKTAICELIIYYLVKKHPDKKILFLAPFRALASELKSGFGIRLGKMGIKNKTMYGGGIATIDDSNDVDEVSLLITTPEKFRAIQNIKPEIDSMFSTIICDEGHLLDSPARGLGYELLLARLKGTNTEDKRFIFLSAIISNIGEINEWLGGTDSTLISTNYKPTEVEFAFLDLSHTGTSYQLIFNPTKEFPEKYILSNFITHEDLQYKDLKTGKLKTYKDMDSMSNITRSVVTALKFITAGQVALFVPQKGGRSGLTALAEEVIKQLDLLPHIQNPLNNANQEAIHFLSEYFLYIFGKDYLLAKIVQYGVVFHHGNLPQNVREIIEKSLQNKDVNFVICTSTLAEGVNLPIKTMIIHTARRFNGEKLAPLLTRDLKNITGRVGRSGKERKGVVIVTNPGDFHTIAKVIKNDTSEEVTGYLYHINQAIYKYLQDNRIPLSNEILDTQNEQFKEMLDTIDTSLIDLLGEEVNAEDLENAVNELLKQTFAYYQSNDAEGQTLRSLLQLRSKALLPFVEQNQLKMIKAAAATPRLYKEIEGLIEGKIHLWQTEDVLDLNLVNGIFEILENIASFTYKIEEFNRENDTIIEIGQLKSIAISWMSGNWYQKIAEENNLKIEILLKVFSSLIEYALQNMVSTILRIGEQKLFELEGVTSHAVQNWCYYLLYGLKNRQQLNLTKLGFTERIGIIFISNYLEDEQNVAFSDTKDLKHSLLVLEKEILEYLKERIPSLSYGKVIEAFRFLKIKNIY